MRLSILSESLADEAALQVIAAAILGPNTTFVEHLRLRVSGVSGVRSGLGAVIRHLHYRGLADGLLVVVDSDHSYVSKNDRRNVLHALQTEVVSVTTSLAPVQGHAPLRVAVGVAVPTIEAWLLCKDANEVTEAAWEASMKSNSYTFTKLHLKRRVYGTDKPDLELEIEKMLAAAKRVVADLSS